jgi:hypothetical protein
VDGNLIKVCAQLGVYIIAMGGWVQGFSASQFSPPYSNDQYVCRCLPLIHNNDSASRSVGLRNQAFEVHHKMCELRTYVQALHDHITFFKELFDGQTDTVAAWFNRVGRDVSVALADQVRIFITTNKTKYDRKYIQDLETFEQMLRTNPTHAVRSDVIIMLQADNRAMNRELRGLLSFFSWLFGMADEIAEQHEELKRDVWLQFKEFPFKELSQRLRSGVMRGAVNSLDSEHSFKSLWSCWNVLEEFVKTENEVQQSTFDTVFAADIEAIDDEKLTDLEKKITCAFVCTKDFADMMYVFHTFNTHRCLQTQIENGDQRFSLTEFIKQNAVFDIFAIYTVIDNLRIEKMLDEISRTIKGFFKALDKLQQQANTSFVGWLQSKWVLMPIAVGVVIVKVVQYFWMKDSSATSSSSSSSSSLFSARVDSSDGNRKGYTV